MTKRFLLVLLGLLILLALSAACSSSSTGGGTTSIREAPTPSPSPSLSPPPSALPSEVCIDALRTDTLLDYGYNHPDEIICVEGTILDSYYALSTNGQPTFLNFHDPHEGWFTALIWGSDRDKFPDDPENYYRFKTVRISGTIELYKGTPEIILSRPSQIEIVEGSDIASPDHTVLVTRIIDGDTIEIESGEVIRYIGIDSPETVHPEKPAEYFGKEAAEMNNRLVKGKRVRLEKDIQDKDDYGRLLRYVWLGDTMVNAELIRQGYAYSYSLGPNIAYQELFLQAELEARQNERGLWSSIPTPSAG